MGYCQTPRRSLCLGKIGKIGTLPYFLQFLRPTSRFQSKRTCNLVLQHVHKRICPQWSPGSGFLPDQRILFFRRHYQKLPELLSLFRSQSGGSRKDAVESAGDMSRGTRPTVQFCSGNKPCFYRIPHDVPYDRP